MHCSFKYNKQPVLIASSMSHCKSKSSVRTLVVQSNQPSIRLAIGRQTNFMPMRYAIS